MGAASGIGAATAALVSMHDAEVISVDINVPGTPVGRIMQADLSDRSSIDRLVAALPSGAHGLANIAGLPPTRPAEAALKVNLVGLKYLTTQLVPKFLRCELGMGGAPVDRPGQEESPRVLILQGFRDGLGLHETSWDIWLVERMRIELTTSALRTRRSPS
jgi:NAD(P)-dependent dehydrogenase (short-subunit alcohol dehydrogenase family)